MYKQSILVSIHDAVNPISWEKPIQKEKAIKLCTSIFGLYSYNNYLLNDYISLSSNYFTYVLPSKTDFIIKQKLVEYGVLQCDHRYSVAKGIAKGYRFNPTFFEQTKISSTTNTFTCTTISNKSPISYLFPTSECLHLQTYYTMLLQRLTFDDDIDELIVKLSTITLDQLVLNDNISEQYFHIVINKKQLRYSKEKAIALAIETGNDLIQYKNSYYIDLPASFIANKSRQLNIYYCHSVFKIKNSLFYCNRNDTNNRLDYNLTGFKKELFTKVKFDGETLVELDIANAQFAIAAHLNPAIDANFTYHAQAGTLYSYVEKKLDLPAGSGKLLMFRIAFDRVKPEVDYDRVRCLFPKFMNWVDSYKKEHGYKMFANLLQKTESAIMIDGLLTFLMSNGYEVFTIHDALRVKQSQVDQIRVIVNEYFSTAGFVCHLRQR